MPRRRPPVRYTARSRRPLLEALEDRRLLASDWTDEFNSRDVNGDWLVAPVDALILINKINRDGSGPLPLPRPADTPSYDTNGDGRLAPVDVLAVVDTINNDSSGPLVTTALVNDTAAGGTTNSDLLTFDVRVAGQVNDATGIRTLRGIWNNQTLDVAFTRGGQYTFVPPAATDGSQDGPQTIRLVATDARGNSTTQTLNVMFDTTPPVPASLGLTAATDTGTSSNDGITNLVSPTAQLTIEPGSFVRLLLDGTQVGSETTGGSSQFPLPTLLEGEHALQVIAEDPAGNVSPPSVPTTIQVDLTSPTAELNLDAPVRSATDTFELAFSEQVSSAAFSAGSYTVEQQGSGALPLQQVVSRPPNIAQLRLASPLDDGSYHVRLTAPPTDLAGNPLAGTIEFAFDVDRLTSIQRLSPAAGESLVSVTRETIVRFDNPIDPATVGEDAFYLVANGQRVEGRRVVSSTERFMTFFYDTPLPAATEVRIVVDGNLIRGRDGKLLDADRDGQPGGVATADFRTLPLTRIAGTNVFGFVRDSYSGQPIVGATIRVDAFPEANTVTDASGRFELMDMPAPDFYVHIDGSTATSVPAGFAYPNVGKPFHSVPGQTVQLEMSGQPFDIFLPPMALSDVQDLSSSDATVVGFGAAGKAELAQMFPDVDPAMFDRMGVTIAPGAAVDEQGNAATQAIVIPVPADRIPAPLPPNLNPSLVVSIQAPGATNFDVPASIAFPNLDGLAPGEKTLVMSFDHDAGRWVVNGTATVSDDGLSVVSDPGTGIAAPGWHILATLLGLDVKAQEYSCGEIGEAAATSVRKDAALMLNALSLGVEVIDVGPGSLIGRIPLLGTAVDIGLDAIAFSLSVSADFVSAGEASFDNISYLTWAGGATSALASVNDALLVFPLADPVLESIDAGVTALSVGSATWNAIKAKVEFIESLANCVADVADEVAAVADQIGQVIDAGAELLDRAEQLYRSFRHWVVYASDTVALANDAPAEDTGTLGGIFRQIENIYSNGLDGLQTLSSSALGTFSTTFGHLQQQFRQVSGQFTGLVQRTTIPSVGAAIAVETSAGLVLRGLANREGIATFQVPPGEVVRITGHNPASNLRGEFNLPSTASERSLDFTLLLNDDPGADLDLDGLDDVAEHTWGTLADNPDSDDDGIDDLTEILQGLNPLDNRGFPTGIIASLPLSGEAKAVALEGSTLDAGRQLAYVATGSHGLAIVDTSQFNNPIVLGQLDLPGDATDVAIDTARQLAVVAAGAGGLHLVDVSDPMQPVLAMSLAVNANQVELFDGLAYAAVGPSIQGLDLATGMVLEQLSLGSDPLTGLAREGNLLLTMDDNNLLRAIELSTAGMVPRDSLALPHGGGRLFVGGGVAYVPATSYFRGGFATIDVSDPSQLAVISQSDVVSPFIGPGTFIFPNGSGLGLLLGQPGGQAVADVMDLSDLAETNELLTRFNLPAAPFDAALGSGIAFIADGTAGLQVVNFVPFDNLRQAPTVTIQTTAIDLDPDTAGTQVQEGTTVTILSDIRDDVQVRNVQLLLAGQIIANDVSFPFDFSLAVPRIAQQGGTLNVQLRATDTGGNTTDSDPLVLHIVPDTFAPAIVQVTPADGGRRFAGHRTVVVRFSEPMDAATLTAANLQLVALSNPTMPIAPQEIQVRRDGHEVQLTYPALAVDDYRLTIQTANVTDRAGNPLLGDNLVSHFAVLEDRDPGDTLPTALDVGLLDAVFTLDERIGQDELGDPDLGDLIGFQLDQPREIRLDLTNRTDGSQLRLIADLDGDGQIDGGEVLRETGTPGTGNLMIVQDLEAGAYFVQILRYYNDDVTAYTLTITPGTIIVPTTPYDPGDTFGAALPLGTLVSTAVSYQDMYGVWDTVDYYKFTIDQPREVRIDLTGRREGGYMRLIADLNGNGTLDGGEELRSAGTPGSGDANITQDLEAGEYFVQVVRYYNDHITPYTLTVTPGTIIV
ncbi:MAG: Ig-like domain-containing protein, partial [Pirellulaceae bacterium]|nr:Ig-like domain-containing protein [Pirellulaceae bacterium]